MQAFEHRIMEVAANVWNTILGRALFQSDAGTGEASGTQLSARVDIRGAWNGSIYLTCTEELARVSAACMFTVPPEELEKDDIPDALGELVNIVAGNLKAMLPAPAELSLPQVSDGAAPPLPASGVQTRMTFECGGHQVEILVRGDDK